jgi:hypothetical protein
MRITIPLRRGITLPLKNKMNSYSRGNRQPFFLKKKKGKKEKEHIHFVSARPPIANPGGGVATPYGTGGAITPRVCCG